MFDNKTDNTVVFDSYKEFSTWLKKLYQISTVKPIKDKPIEFYHAPLISPAIYDNGQTRANSNVERWSKWAMLDIDVWKGSVEDIQTSFSDYEIIAYNTPSCKEDNVHFRLIVHLSREIDKKEFPHFWYALKKEIGVGDEQTKDMARMFYVPGQYPGAYSFFFERAGKPLDPDEIINKYPLPKQSSSDIMDYLDDDLKKELYSRRIKNKNIKWSSYKDCPFINKELIAEYMMLSGTGWYHKMYQIMVSIAKKAMLMNYPITSHEIETLCRELDGDTGNWYTKRPLGKEAERAIKFALSSL